MDQSGRVVVVTGAASGIGRAVAEAFADAGWRVAAVDVCADADRPGVRTLQADVADPGQVAAVWEDVAANEGRVDALVNNAAVQLCRPLEEIEPAEWDRTMAVNVRSVFLMTRGALPLMGPGSAVVNISSVHALASSPQMSAYAASKGAVVAMTRALAVELAPRAIRVNAVLPGAIDTPMLAAGLQRATLAGNQDGESAVAELARRTPAGRIGRPSEVAQIVLVLADPQRSSFVTGSCFVADGGATARLGTE